MSKLVLMRHGESLWNEKDLLTGWVDVPLSKRGIDQAIQAGKALQSFTFDVIYTSTLIRAIETAVIVIAQNQWGKIAVVQEFSESNQSTLDDKIVPMYLERALNERMHGTLQGLSEKVAADQFGDVNVKLWRSTFDGAPPQGESFKMVAQRSIEWFERRIPDQLAQGKNILISGHGTTLKALMMHIEKISEATILSMKLPNGSPIVYEYFSGKYQLMQSNHAGTR